jgi:hypothetical protein
MTFFVNVMSVATFNAVRYILTQLVLATLLACMLEEISDRALQRSLMAGRVVIPTSGQMNRLDFNIVTPGTGRILTLLRVVVILVLHGVFLSLEYASGSAIKNVTQQHEL